jgi:capsular polysaccharide transport system permease protein
MSRAHNRVRMMRFIFLLLVIVPVCGATLYYGLLAAPRYVSEGQFVVRGVNSTRINGLDAFFRTFGIARAVDDAHVVQSYILSRDAVHALEQQVPLREIFGRKEGDWFARFPRFWQNASFERLYEYYLDRVSVVQDGTTGITTLRVVTFRPEDSHLVAQKLMSLAEGVANRMNARAQADAASLAQGEVTASEQRVMDAQAALTTFRNRALLIDPSKSNLSSLETITSLTTEMAQTLARVRQTVATSPASPGLESLRAKANALEDRIKTERGKVAGDDTALAAKVSEYDKLVLNRDLADKSLAGAVVSLENARQEARRQQIYLESIVAPGLSDEATEPRRLRMIMTVLVLCFALFSVVWIISVGIEEHAQEL